MSDPGHSSAVHVTLTHNWSRSTLPHQPGGRTKKSPGKEQGPPNKTPTRTTRATKGTKGKEHRNQTFLGATNDLPACAYTYTKSTESSYYRQSFCRPSTPAGVHQLGQRRYRTGRNVTTLDSQARTLKHQSEIYLKGDNKVEHHRLPDSFRKP